MELFKLEQLRSKLIDEYYTCFYPNYLKENKKCKQTISTNNRSPCTSLWRLKDTQIVPIEMFRMLQVKVNLVMQEVMNGALYCVVNSHQISKTKLTELFDDACEMKRFRISLKNIKKIFSDQAVIYLRKRSFKGEKAKIDQYYTNKTYF